MRNLVEKTGGLVLNEEEFDSEVFEKCAEKYFETICSEDAVYNASIKTFCSKELYLSGMIGPGQLAEKDKNFPKDAENCFGESGGSSFVINSPTPTTSFVFFYSLRDSAVEQKQKPCFFQFQTTYLTPGGKAILRVATFMREFIKDDK